MLKVDKNVPLKSTTGRSGPWKYPYETMEVGDSFETPAATIYASVSQRMRRHPGKIFTVRKVNGVYRCWRTA